MNFIDNLPEVNSTEDITLVDAVSTLAQNWNVITEKEKDEIAELVASDEQLDN